MKSKVCTKCSLEKQLCEFYKDKYTKDGFRPSCKICDKIRMKKYRLKNGEKFRALHKSSYEKNKQKILARQKTYRDNNSKKIQQFKKEHYVKNKKEINIKSEIYQSENKQKILLQRKKYRKENTEKIVEGRKKFRQLNKESLNQKSRIYYSKNKEKINKQRKQRFQIDIRFKMLLNLRNRLAQALRGNTKSLPTMFLIGCEVDYLMYHIQNQFIEGMSWDNYGLYGWHIDHIKPCASFDLDRPDQQKECFHFSNLQPLWAEDNFAKGCK